MLVYKDPSLVLFFSFYVYCIFYTSPFSLLNVGCGLGYHQVHRSKNLQTCKSILSYFSYPTLSHFLFVVELFLWDTNPFLILQILETRNPQTHITQKDLSYLCIMHNAHITFFIVILFLEYRCGTPFHFHFSFP
jgi:hypothetical protein